MNDYKNHTSTRNLNYKFKVISALKYMYVFSFHIIKDFTGTCNMHGFLLQISLITLNTKSVLIYTDLPVLP